MQRSRRLATRLVVCIVLSAAAVACDPDSDGAASGGAWVGTITTEGDVTTVVNESGSVWRGTATLVEEASIGIESGADEYMLGNITGLAATDAHIVVADSQVPAVRVYDFAGKHVRDLGREGQGPGEYTYPAELGIRPDGALVVKDGQRIVVFALEGEALATWNVGRMMGFTMLENPLIVAVDGVPFAPQVTDVPSPDSITWKWAMFPIHQGGEAGEPVPVPEVAGPPPERLKGDEDSIPVPFSPESKWSFSPTRAFVSGHSADYRFEVRRDSGEALVIERVADPVVIQADEAAWYRDATTAWMRQYFEGWTWNGPDIAAAKPAYDRLMPDRDGRVWVQRPGPGRRVPECRVTPPYTVALDGECWRDDVVLDVFGADGRFLGSSAAPPGMRFYPRPFIHGDAFIAVVEDDAGTIMVKRYRLVLPGEPQS